MISASDNARLIGLLAGIPVIVIGLANFPITTFAGLAGLGWWAISKAPGERWRRLFLFAAVFGTLGEAICVYGEWTGDGRGLWYYAFPSPFQLSWKLPVWLPLVWGNLFVLFAGLSDEISRRLEFEKHPREGLRFVIALAVVVYAAVLFRTINVRILYVFTPFFAGFLLYWNTLRDLTLFVVAGLLGSVGEIIAMREGLWVYTMPKFSNDFTEALGVDGIPISLAMAWGLSAVFLNRWAERRLTWQG